jgi:hypothetical protein
MLKFMVISCFPLHQIINIECGNFMSSHLSPTDFDQTLHTETLNLANRYCVICYYNL